MIIRLTSAPVVHVSRRAACPLITAPNATTDHVPGVARSVGHRGELGLCHGLGLNGISVVVLVVDVVDMVTSLATQRSEPQPAGPPSPCPRGHDPGPPFVRLDGTRRLNDAYGPKRVDRDGTRRNDASVGSRQVRASVAALHASDAVVLGCSTPVRPSTRGYRDCRRCGRSRTMRISRTPSSTLIDPSGTKPCLR
jgi:hypothetical protein